LIKTIYSSKAVRWVLIVFLLSVVIRIPQLARPFSHHHESISALELVAIESWQQAGGPSPFNYIPVTNYQQPGDKQKADALNTDKMAIKFIFLTAQAGISCRITALRCCI